MSNSDYYSQQAHLEKVIAGKKELKKELIRLSFPEKIKRIIEMQKFSRDFAKDKTKKIYVWTMESLAKG